MHKSIISLVNKDELKKLNKVDNTLAIYDLIIRVLITVLLLTLVISLHSTSPFWALLAWYLYCIQIHFWGYAGLGHEAYHGKVFSSNNANKLLFWWCSSVTWSNSYFFAKSHNYHHSHTFSDGDHEATSESSWGFINLVFYSLTDVKLLIRRIKYTVFNSVGYFPDGKKIEAKGIVNSAQQVLITNFFILLITYLTSESIIVTLLIGVAPFTATLLNKVLAKSQHHGLKTEDNSDPFNHSRTLKLPKILSFFYANMNYHVEHHLVPSIPYYNLPKLNERLEKDGRKYSISLTSFIKAWVKGEYDKAHAK